MYPVLSFNCSRLLIPESTIITLSRDAANRTAQEGIDIPGAYSKKSSSAFFGIWARVPPFTGSITITGTPCFLAVS